MSSLRPLRLTAMLLPLAMISIALIGCSNAPPGPLAVVSAPKLALPTRPTPEAPAPVKLRDLSWQVVLDPKTHEPIFGLSVQGLIDLEGNEVMLGQWMSDSKAAIDFYRADNAAANAENAPSSSAKDADKK